MVHLIGALYLVAQLHQCVACPVKCVILEARIACATVCRVLLPHLKDRDPASCLLQPIPLRLQMVRAVAEVAVFRKLQPTQCS